MFKGYHAWIISSKSEFFDKIGLKASQKIPVLNGAIECEFREFVIFDGKYDDFVKEGNSVKKVREENAGSSERRPRRDRDAGHLDDDICISCL